MTSEPTPRPQTSTTVAELSADFPALGLIARTTEPPEKEWLDGPKLAAFIEQRCPSDWGGWTDSKQRTIRRWKAGHKARLDAADRMLVYLDIHLNELPDDVWTDPPKRSWHAPIADKIRRQAVGRVRAGESVTVVARSLGISARAVRHWIAGSRPRGQTPQDAD